MAAKVSIVEAYADASIEKKIKFILENYSGFEKMLEGYEQCLTIQIRTEREFNRRKNQADLGIRVQTSGLSDTTARIAIENVAIEEAIKKGDIEDVVKGTEEADKHRREIFTLLNMKEDFVLVSSQILLLCGDEHELFRKYLEGRESITDMADARGISYNCVQKRINRSKKIVISQSTLFMESKYRYV